MTAHIRLNPTQSTVVRFQSRGCREAAWGAYLWSDAKTVDHVTSPQSTNTLSFVHGADTCEHGVILARIADHL